MPVFAGNYIRPSKPGVVSSSLAGRARTTAVLAQLVEQRIRNAKVASSIPASGTT